MSLAESQQRFAQALFEHGASAAALSLFKGDAQANEARLALYRGNLTAAWDKALANAYPVLRQLVGAEFFGALAREYGRAHPSREGDLNRFGTHFADFLTNFPHVAQYPYFPDMARLEWALHRAHYAAASEPLALDVVTRLTPQELDGARLLLQPACSLFSSQWAVVAIWHAHQEDEAAIWPQEVARPDYALLLRRHWRAEPLPVTAAAHAALAALQQGSSVGAALEAAIGIDTQFDAGVHLQSWLHLGVFAGIQITRE